MLLFHYETPLAALQLGSPSTLATPLVAPPLAKEARRLSLSSDGPHTLQVPSSDADTSTFG